jgi:hypothetical protein
MPLLADAAVPAETLIADQSFAKLADQYFDTFYLPTNASAATSCGIHLYDGKLEDFSRSGIVSEVESLEDWERRVAAVDQGSLSLFVRGDRDLVLNNIRSSLLTLQAIRPWEKNPDFHSSGITCSAFTLMERKFAPISIVRREMLHDDLPVL